jgi:formylglycine-generating enzyme required for sulfatase activity
MTRLAAILLVGVLLWCTYQSTGQAQNTAPTLSEVLNSTGIAAWQNAGWAGAGQRIGVIDRGFGGLLEFQGEAGLSVGLVPGSDATSYSSDSFTGGTNTLRLIHEVAPQATLYACRYSRFDEYTTCLNYLFRQQGVKILHHGSGVGTSVLDGTSRWAADVVRLAQEDVLWINATGDFGKGYLNSTFTLGGLRAFHEFADGIDSLRFEDSRPRQVQLSWEDPEQNLDIYLHFTDLNGEQLDVIQTPKIYVDGQASLWAWVEEPFVLQLGAQLGSTAGTPFQLLVEFAEIPDTAPGASLLTPADSLVSLTVGGLDDEFSGVGSTKPDLLAPALVSLPEGLVLEGSTVSSALIAGTAALIWEANPGWRYHEVAGFLREQVGNDKEFALSAPLTAPIVAVPDNTRGNNTETQPIGGNDSDSSPESLSPVSPLVDVGSISPVASNAEWTPIISNVNGFDVVFVPPGCFMMGSQVSGEEMPVHETCLEGFWLGRTEVTNDQYGSVGAFSGENNPRDNITWIQAQGFCANVGGRLPSEAEWEYAARGPDGLLWPWGNENPSSGLLNYNEIMGGTAPVASFPAGDTWVGATDMSGNVSEWTNSLYFKYPYVASDGRENITNQVNMRIVRGGSWGSNVNGLRITHRGYNDPNTTNEFRGFRCAFSVE